MEKPRGIVYFGLFVVVFSLVFIGPLFFAFRQDKTVKNVPNDTDISKNYLYGDKVELKNILPVSDAIGKEFTGEGTEKGIQGYLEFSIKSKVKDTVRYQIYLTKELVEGREISGNYIKFYLTNFNNAAFEGFNLNKLPTFDELSVISDKPGSKLLYTGELDSLGEEKFILRSWISDSYALGQYDEFFNYTVDIRVI